MQMYKNRLEENEKKHQQSINRFLSLRRCNMPSFMSILVTNRCDLRCKHCFYHYSQTKEADCGGKELTLDEYNRISKSMDIIIKAIFSGGEPFLREDFFEIINLFQRQNKILYCSSSTNGQNTDKIVHQVEKIVTQNPYQLFSLAVSLDGYEEEHDAIRGNGTFQKALTTWHELKKVREKHQNFEMYICPTINSLNKKNMPSFIEWCVKTLDPAFVSLLKTRQSPRGGEYLKEVSCEEYQRAQKEIEKQIKKGNMGDVNQPQTYINSSICSYVRESLSNGRRSFNCLAGCHGGFMDYNGDVGVCEIMPVLGNIREYNYHFLSLWNAPQVADKRLQVGKQPCCERCTHETEGIIPSLFFGGNSLIYC